MEYKVYSSNDIMEGVWDEETCVRRQAGFSLDKSNLPSDLSFLPKGAPLALDANGENAVLVKTAEVYENATSATSVKITKRNAIVAGDTVGGQKVSAIDKSNSSYDVLTMAVAITAKKGDIIADANNEKVIGLNYATVKMDSYPSVTPTLQAYEIEEDTLPYPLDDKIKTALTNRHSFKL